VFICRHTEGVHGQRKVGTSALSLVTCTEQSFKLKYYFQLSTMNQKKSFRSQESETII